MTTPASHPISSKLRCIVRPLAFTAGLALIFGAFYAIGYERYESRQIRSDRKNLARMATGNGVVFGSSHAFNLLPEEIGFEGVNLSHGGQDLFEMVYMARAVKRAAPELETVFFTLSYFSFALDNAAFFLDGTQSRIGRRIVMYSAFPTLGFVPGDASSWVKGVLSPVITRDHWKSIFWPTGSRKGAFPEASDLPPDPKRDRGSGSSKPLGGHARRRCKEYATLMRNMASNHPDLENDAFEALRDISMDLEKAGVRVVLVTVPYYETYNECFDAKRQALTRRLAKRVAAETGAEYIDAGNEPDFTSTRRYFHNSDHMNREGKLAFSRWLGERLALKKHDDLERGSRGRGRR
jgi:hypothetical protein